MPREYDHAIEGPKTCLSCHTTIRVNDGTTGKERTVGPMEDVTTSAHYSFFTDRHPNLWGLEGKLAENVPVGRIDRPCPEPGSFAFLAWAEQVTLGDGRMPSEGCGQRHIGGEYQAPPGGLVPTYGTTAREKAAIDCLICHSAGYDTNRKQVVKDRDGLMPWEEDRTMRAAAAVAKTTTVTYPSCHGPSGVIDWRELGYTAEGAAKLSSPRAE